MKTNVRGKPMAPFFKDISIQEVSDAGTRTETYSIGVVGGTVGRVVTAVGGDHNSSPPSSLFAVTWDGDALVFESGTYPATKSFPKPQTGWAERREVWSLDPGGRLHVVVTTRDATSGERTAELVYRRE